MKNETWAIADAFWLHDLGLGSESFDPPRVVCTVQRLYNGVQMLRRGDTLVIAVPPERHEHIENCTNDVSTDQIFSVDWLKSTLGEDAAVILGPAEVYYADETAFRFAATNA